MSNFTDIFNMQSKYILEVKDLTKRYQDGDSEVVALEKVSFKVKRGEDLAVVGPSGSGKTTLLQLIGAINTPSSGSVIIDGKDISSFSDKEVSQFRNNTIGFVFQSMYLQDYLTSLENVMIPLLINSVNIKTARQKAETLLVDVGLKDRLNHRPNQLSGGEMQRVAIARALANSPKLILADEPTGKLDEDNANRVMDLLQKVSGKDVSVIVITHDKEIAKRFNRSLTLKHGKLID